jgi:hypothetical protein
VQVVVLVVLAVAVAVVVVVVAVDVAAIAEAEGADADFAGLLTSTASSWLCRLVGDRWKLLVGRGFDFSLNLTDTLREFSWLNSFPSVGFFLGALFGLPRSPVRARSSLTRGLGVLDKDMVDELEHASAAARSPDTAASPAADAGLSGVQADAGVAGVECKEIAGAVDESFRGNRHRNSDPKLHRTRLTNRSNHRQENLT